MKFGTKLQISVREHKILRKGEKQMKKMVDVYQCELGKTIPLEYVGMVKFIGSSDMASITDGCEYMIVLDEDGNLKVVDNEEEDYNYDLSAPTRGSGKFYYMDDPQGVLKKYMAAYEPGVTESQFK